MTVTSFEVGAIFTIQNEASASLGQMSEQFARLDELARSVQATLEAVGKDGLAGLSAGVDRFGNSLAGLETRVRDFGGAMESSVNAAGSALTRATGEADALAGAIDRAAAAARAFASSSAGGGIFGGPLALAGPGGGGGDGGGPPTIDGEFEDLDRRRLLPGPAATEAEAFAAGAAGGGAAGGGGGRGGSGGGGGGGRGGHGGMLHGMLPLIEVFGGYESYKAAASEDLSIRNALIEGLHIRPGTPEFAADFKRLHEIAAQASAGTIFSRAQAAEAMPTLARELGFTGPEGITKFGQIFRPALQAAEVAQMTGLGNMHDSLAASVEYAHMTGSYEPKELEKHLNVLRAIAQLTNRSMHTEEQILKYSVPIGISAGMDADQTAIATGFLQQQGFNSSTAGTGLSALILGALNTGGGIGGHLEHARRSLESEFEHSLHMTHTQALHAHGGRGSKHVQALHELGIMNAGGHLTTVDAHGNFDLNKLEEDIFKYSQTHTKQTVLETLHDAFGTRGERVAGIFTETGAMDRERRFQHAVATSPTAREIQGDLAQSPMQQFEQMLANIANIGNTLATSTLGPLNTTLKTLNTELVQVDQFLEHHHTASELTAGGLLGLGGLALFGGVKGASRVLGLTKAGGAGRAVGAAAEGGLLGRFWPLIVGSMLWDTDPGDINSHLGFLNDTPAQAWGALENWITGRKTEAQHTGAPTGPSQHQPPPPANQQEAAKPAAPASTTIYLTVHNQMNGVADESTFDHLLHKLTHAIQDALQHASGAAGGNDQSIYLSGGLPF